MFRVRFPGSYIAIIAVENVHLLEAAHLHQEVALAIVM